MITYHNPVGVSTKKINERNFFITKSGGYILTDSTLMRIWQIADGITDKEIVERLFSWTIPPEQLRGALACLTEAGLLERQENQGQGDSPEMQQKALTCRGTNEELISAIIVCHNSRFWLEKCLHSLLAQAYSSVEIVLIDNGSSDGSAEWLAEAFPTLKVISLDRPQSLARALNTGIDIAQGEYYLILNPDVELEHDALSGMIDIARGNPSCAAVIPKLRFTWAPAFLNGLGNFVGAFSWGTDCGLGHLDLGQFDGWQEVPSACFAAILIPSDSYRKVGAFDEDYPLYYEDSDWSYRARLLGYTILAAPKAVVYHGFGQKFPETNNTEMKKTKLHQVSYGRIRFVTKIVGWKYLIRFLLGYLVEDVFRGGLALIKGNGGRIRTILQAWFDYYKSLSKLIRTRRNIQKNRVCSDNNLLRLQKTAPIPLSWRGLPYLTWSIVRNHYLPQIISGQAREVPEISRDDLSASMVKTNLSPIPSLRFAFSVWRIEGFRASVYWMGKTIQWYLMQP